MSKEVPFWWKLYFDDAFREVAILVGYQGLTYREFQAKLEPLYERLGKVRVESAAWHVTCYEGQNTVNPKPLAHVWLRRDVRQLCWQLLGPPPDHEWYELWHKPEPLPLPWETPLPEKKLEAPPTPEQERLRKLNRRQLACMLRDARQKLSHNGKRSHSGKLAKQEIALAEAEYQRRGLPLPPPGEEVPAQ